MLYFYLYRLMANKTRLYLCFCSEKYVEWYHARGLGSAGPNLSDCNLGANSHRNIKVGHQRLASLEHSRGREEQLWESPGWT